MPPLNLSATQLSLRRTLDRLPMRPTTLMEYRALRIRMPSLRMDTFFIAAVKERFAKQQIRTAVRRSEQLKVYIVRTHQKIVSKNIERLKVRRSELLYCSKRARPIPMHKQLGIFQSSAANSELQKTARELRRHILSVRGHNLSHFQGFRSFINRVLSKPFTTMMETIVRGTSNRLRAFALKTKSAN